MNAYVRQSRLAGPTALLAVALAVLLYAHRAVAQDKDRGAGNNAAIGAGNDAVNVSDAAGRRGGMGATLSESKFVPGSLQYVAGSVMELRGEATIVGEEIKLRQVCRWADADKATFEPLGGLVIARIGRDTPFRGISIDELKQTLSDAGVNLAMIRVAGATSCTVHRSDVQIDQRTALQQWIDARESAATPTTLPAPGNSAAGVAVSEAVGQLADTGRVARGGGNVEPLAPEGVSRDVRDDAAIAAGLRLRGPNLVPPTRGPAPVPDSAPVERHASRTLREMLVGDLAERLALPPDLLQVRFNPVDDKAVNLAEPLFRFNIDGRRAHQLGNVTWDVTIVSDGASQKLSIVADARAWQQQLVLLKPVAFRQLIRDEDLVERRVLVDMMPNDLPAVRTQVVGQMAAREMKAGTVMTPRLVDAVPLVQIGQLVTVTLQAGSVEVKTVARAMESGTFGQTVRVRNEASNDVMQVILVGPQEGKMMPSAGKGTAGDAAAAAR